LNLKTAAFNLSDVPEKWARGIRTGEDVFSHEDSPDEVLILPESSQTCNLEEENTVVLEEWLNLSHEVLVVSDSNMLTHFKASDLVELLVHVHSQITVVEEDQVDFAFNAVFLYFLFSIFELTFGDSHTNTFNVEVFGAVNQPGSPSTTEVKNAVSVFDAK
jgi:hypothetical protein